MFNIMIKKTTLFIYCPIIVQVVLFSYIVLKYHILSINNCMVSRQTKVGWGLRAPSSSNQELHKYAKR